jgi:hypothetical protein
VEKAAPKKVEKAPSKATKEVVKKEQKPTVLPDPVKQESEDYDGEYGSDEYDDSEGEDENDSKVEISNSNMKYVAKTTVKSNNYQKAKGEVA